MISATHLHAMLVHFPIALLFTAFLFELISFISKREFFKHITISLVVLAALGAIAAYLSGDEAGEGIENGPFKIPMDLHEDAALITLLLSIVLAVYKLGSYFFEYSFFKMKAISLVLFIALVSSVSYTAYLGGQLVYKHGAGVQLGLPDFTNTDAED